MQVISGSRQIASLPIAGSVKNVHVKPFLKWVGGKSQLIEEIRGNLPKKYYDYYEPFLGGGAVFFKLIPNDKVSYLSDINENLIRSYVHIRDRCGGVLEHYLEIVADFKSLNTENQRKLFFLKIRSQYNESRNGKNNAEHAAQLIFLNKTCFNGVYRENSRGEFNVPYGRPMNSILDNIGHIEAVSRKLKSSNINCQDFNTALKAPHKGDFVYLDPPYVPLLDKNSFTKYHSTDFSMDQQEQLRDIFVDLTKRGCHVLMSNSLTRETKRLYSDYWDYVVEVDANRNINCKGQLRKPIKEVLIKNY